MVLTVLNVMVVVSRNANAYATSKTTMTTVKTQSGNKIPPKAGFYFGPKHPPT